MTRPPTPRLAPRRTAAVAALAGLASSAALLAPYLVRRGFCGDGGGCDQVAQSAYATLLGVPRAAFGVAAFAVMLLAAVLASPRVRRLSPFVGALFAIEGVRLLAIQAFVLGAWCKFCVVVDAAAIVGGLALVADAFLNRERAPLSVGRWAVAAGLAAALPVGLASLRGSVGGDGVGVASAATRVEGKRVIREFVDLQCPYCRMTHVAVKKAIAGRSDVVVERRHVPLAMHPDAFDAAVAACCADEQGQEERFVDAVVATDGPPDAETCRRIAADIGLDLARFDACRASDRPKKRIEDDKALASSSGVKGLPTIDFEGERHVGLLDEGGAAALLAKHP